MHSTAFFSDFRSLFEAAKLPLGINTEFAAGFDVPDDFGASVPCRFDPETSELIPLDKPIVDLRRVRYHLQRVAHNVLGSSHRVGFCHRHLGYNSLGAQIRSSGDRHSLAGLAVCANAWVCPVCASRIASRRADEVRKAILKAKSENLVVELVTLTVPHGIGDSAKSLVDAVAASWRQLTGHRRWNAKGGPRSLPGIKHRAGVTGYVRALEVTHGSNGWHPHLHIIFFSHNGLMDHRCRIWELWSGICVSLGLGQPSLDRGIDIKDGTAAGEYLCKFSDDGDLLQTRQGSNIKWDAADELTLANRKSGRNGSRKPHQILADAEFSSFDACLFREFATAFKGKSQLQFSRGLKKWAEIDELTDEEISERETNTDVVFVIPGKYWQKLINTSPKNDRRSVLIRLSETGGLPAVANYISTFFDAEPHKIHDDIAALTIRYFDQKQ